MTVTRIPVVRNDLGANEGGSCTGCGQQIRFWYVFKLCDNCVKPSLKGAIKKMVI